MMRYKNNNNKIVIILIFYLIFLQKLQIFAYKVLVMEYPINLNSSGSSDDILMTNTENYINIIEDLVENPAQNIDLIIFPEATLSPFLNPLNSALVLPSLSTFNKIILCNSSSSSDSTTFSNILKKFSCASIRFNLTIVINLTEKVVDKINNITDIKFYNTNVVFGNNGTIIARYRKWNLFGEFDKSIPDYLDLPIIEINGSTFGIMTCFDIQFASPSFNLTKKNKVENIIFPLNWISELPYLTALQVQQMWAQEMNVTLLASGASFPQFGAGGSGVFFGSKGTLQSEILPQSNLKLIIQEVSNKSDFSQAYLNTSDLESIDNEAALLDSFFMLVDRSIYDHNSVVLNLSENFTNTTICHGDEPNILCCNFQISFKLSEKINHILKHNSYIYQMVVFNGIRNFSDIFFAGVETCGLIACLNKNLSSCGQRFSDYTLIDWPIIFTNINISGNFLRSKNRIQFPSTLLSSIKPLPVQEYKWSINNKKNKNVIRNLILLKEQKRLLTFGIFGRDFSRDWDPIRKIKNSANRFRFINYMIFLMVLLLLT